jgi:hypothetical protein
LSLTARLVAVGLLLLALSAAAWRAYYKIDQGGYNRAMGEVAAVQAKQADDNRALVRKAELRYTVKAETQTKVINQVVKEIEYVTQNLADCRLDPAAVVLLNRAASAVSAEPTANSPDDKLPAAGTVAK